MIIASCRKYFDSNRFLAADLRYRDVSAAADAPDLTLAGLRIQARNRHVCILVHGYGNPLPDVVAAYAELHAGMKAAGVVGPANYGLVVGFTWPGWRGPAFPIARAAANKAGRHLRRLVERLRPAALSIDVQTHSLGARVALAALTPPGGIFVDNLLLAAPAVDRTLLESGREFHAALDACNRCFVYHSRRDAVLRKFYPLGDAADGIVHALGLNGPRRPAAAFRQHPNLYVVDCTACVPDHGAYRQAAPWHAHWARVLSGAPLPRAEALKPDAAA